MYQSQQSIFKVVGLWFLLKSLLATAAEKNGLQLASPPQNERRLSIKKLLSEARVLKKQVKVSKVSLEWWRCVRCCWCRPAAEKLTPVRQPTSAPQDERRLSKKWQLNEAHVLKKSVPLSKVYLELRCCCGCRGEGKRPKPKPLM